MKKIELVEMIADYLQGGDAPIEVKGKYHPAILEKWVESVYNELIFQTASGALDPKNDQTDFSQLDTFASMYRDIDVLNDTDRSLKYSVLPFPPVKLPEDLGIRMVCPNDDMENPFAHVDNTSQPIFAALEVGTVDTVPIFWIEKQSDYTYRIYFKNSGTVAKVAMLLIVPLSQYDDFDEVPMPAGKDKLVLDMVIDALMRKPQPDNINDNVIEQQ